MNSLRAARPPLGPRACLGQRGCQLTDMDESPYFRAGWMAAQRGWTESVLTPPSGAGNLTPTGPPVVIVMSARDVDVPRARELAAVAGAGRDVLLAITEGEIHEEALEWLGRRVELVPLLQPAPEPGAEESSGAKTPETSQKVDPAPKPETTRQVARPKLPAAGGSYCKLSWPGANKSAGGGSTRGAQYLDRLIDSLHLEGIRDGLCFAACMPSSPPGMASWIEFSAASYSGQQYMVIETPIGAAEPEDGWSRGATASFAWHVVRWCEQPTGAAVKRQGWFKRHTDSPKPPVSEERCFPGHTTLPLRFLSPAEGLMAYRHEPSAIQESIKLETATPIFFEYWVPLHDWKIFESWTTTAVTSLLRMLHLLHDPWLSLPGRDPKTESVAVERLKEYLDFRAYGDLAVRAFEERRKRMRLFAIADGSMTDEEFDALEVVERPLSPGPPLNSWPPVGH